MIDLTPLDVRKKRGDFRRMLRGYDSEEVDTFLNLVAERMETLVKENLSLTERTRDMGEKITLLEDRERAVNDALVTAQKLRSEIREEAERQAERMRKEAESEAQLLKRDAEAELERLRRTAEGEKERLDQIAVRHRDELQSSLQDLARRRARFINTFRGLLERELDMLSVEESRFDDEEIRVVVEPDAALSAAFLAPSPEPAEPSGSADAAASGTLSSEPVDTVPVETLAPDARIDEGPAEPAAATDPDPLDLAGGASAAAATPDRGSRRGGGEPTDARGGGPEGMPEIDVGFPEIDAEIREIHPTAPGEAAARGAAPDVGDVPAGEAASASEAPPSAETSLELNADAAPAPDHGPPAPESEEDYAVWKANLLGHLGKLRPDGEP